MEKCVEAVLADALLWSAPHLLVPERSSPHNARGRSL